MRTKPIVLAIDWDGVIHDRANPVEGKRLGEPLPGAKEAIEKLVDRGFRVVIFTCVAHTPAGHQAVTDWMEYYDIPCHDVTAVKPVADLYIDDKGLRHKNWSQSLYLIGEYLGVDMELNQ
jgi:ribonucleotide monophosphatase NagD (HAD superfamily)